MNNIIITGKSGSGKSYVADKLASILKIKHIDVDRISHEIYAIPQYVQIITDLFGVDVVDQQGAILRSVLSSRYFSHEYEIQARELDKVVWKYIENTLDQYTDNIIIDWILSPITKYWDTGLRVLVTAPNNKTRISRIQARDHITTTAIKNRDSRSPDFDIYSYDFVIINDHTIDDQLEQLSKIAKKFIKKGN